MNEYIEAANVTNSSRDGAWHGSMMGLFLFLKLCREFVEAGKKLDDVKKTMFYGRRYVSPEGNKIDPGFDWGGYNMGRITIDPNIIHGIVGIATESVELIEWLSDTIEGLLRGTVTTPDFLNLHEEGGDILWYLAVLFKALDTTFEAEGRRNIAKLMTRYPDGFSQDNALVRNIAAERATLELEAA